MKSGFQEKFIVRLKLELGMNKFLKTGDSHRF